MTDDCGD